MARSVRIQYPGAVYHVMARGVNRQRIFFDADDHWAFMNLMGEACERFEVELASYCLMPNHIHMLLHTPKGELSRAMHRMLSLHATRTNRKHRRVGHLFQNRYKAILVDTNEYLVRVSRYIHLNPCKARMVKLPEQFTWSSMRPMIEGKMESRMVLERFQTADFYRQYVLEGLVVEDDVLAEVKCGTFLGSDEFVEEMKGRIKFKPMPGVSFRRPLSALPGLRLEEAIRGRSKKIAMYALFKYGRVRQRLIGARFCVAESAVSMAVKRLEQRLPADPQLQRELEEIRKAVVKCEDTSPEPQPADEVGCEM